MLRQRADQRRGPRPGPARRRSAARRAVDRRGRRRVATVLAARRGLPAPARRGLSVARLRSGSCSPSSSSSTRRSSRRSTASGLLLVAIGIDPRRGRRRSPGPTRATGCRPGSRRSSARCTSSLLGVHPPARPRGAGRCRPARRSAALGAGPRLDPAARPRGLVVRHGRVLRRQALRAAQVPDPHLAVQDVRGADRRDRRRDGRRRAGPRRASASRPSTALLARAARCARRPGRRPRRVDAQARRRREGLGHADPGPRRHPRPGRLVPVRGAGR